MPIWTAELGAHPTEDSVSIPRASTEGHVTGGVTVTVGKQTGNVLAGAWFAAPYMADFQTAVAASGNTITLSNLHYNRQFANGWADGGDVSVFRVVPDGATVTVRNGTSYTNTKGHPELVLIRKDTIQSCISRECVYFSGDDPWQGGRVNDTTADWQPFSYHKPGGTVYYRVCTIDASGNWGPLSAAVSTEVGTNLGNINFTINDPSTRGNPVGSYSAGLDVPTGLTLTNLDADGNVTTDPAQKQVVRASWNAVAGAAGYGLVYSFDPECDEVSQLVLAGDESAPLANDDWVVYSKEFAAVADKNDVVHHRIWNSESSISRLVAFKEFPVWPGEKTQITYLTENEVPFGRVENHIEGTLGLALTVFGGTAQFQRKTMEPGKTYEMRFRMRSPDAPLTASLSADDASVSPTSVNLTTEWQDFSATITPSFVPRDTSVASQRINFTALPANRTIDMQYFYVCEAGTTPLTGWTPREQELLDEGAPEFIRFHNTCKTRWWSYRLTDIVRAPGSARVDTIGLHQIFSLCEAAGANPWIQIEAHWIVRPDDILGLMEYIHAPYDEGAGDTPVSKPWAYARVQAGRAAPWSDAFDKLWIEIGNEAWQSPTNAEFYAIQSASGYHRGAVNAMVSDYFWEVMATSPHADMAKWDMVLGGQVASGNGWNTPNIDNSQHGRYMTIADYNGGWDAGQDGAYDPDNPESHQIVAANAPFQARAYNAQLVADQCAARTAARVLDGNNIPLGYGTYEAGPGYPQPSAVDDEQALNQAEVMRSIVAANATLDCFWTNGANGMVSQNWFTMNEGAKSWHSHNRWDMGGTVPPYMWMQWWNRHLKGAILRETDRVLAFEKYMEIGSRNPKPGTHAYEEMLSVLRADKDGVAYVFLYNRDTDAARSVRVHMPASTPVHRHRMIGPDGYLSHNQSFARRNDIAIIEDVVTINQVHSETLARGDAVVYEFGSPARNNVPGVLSIADTAIVSGGSMEIDLRPFVKGCGPFTWVITGPGVASVNGSVVTMTDSIGTTTVTATATNAGGASNTETFDVKISPELVTVSPGSTAGWNVSGATLSTDGSVLTITPTGTNPGASAQVTGLVPGRQYRIQRRKGANGDFRMATSADLTSNWLKLDSRDYVFEASASTMYFGVWCAGLVGEIRALSIYEWVN